MGNGLRKLWERESEAGKGGIPIPDASMSRLHLCIHGAHSYWGSLGDCKEFDSAPSHPTGEGVGHAPTNSHLPLVMGLLELQASSGLLHTQAEPVPAQRDVTGPEDRSNQPLRKNDIGRAAEVLPRMLLPVGATTWALMD